ncbi:hypothetical protein RHGRI_013983 [Rhododendron griersonianum]|uniref:Uncharacterized protein n=1 Tax=Rhododendron griersonianum TaxID=479676 RepID=A0AAV6K7M3_9ERIC|nr:hypothetical protein RHGRI_013983 [Rhododendron griersonianum]
MPIPLPQVLKLLHNSVAGFGCINEEVDCIPGEPKPTPNPATTEDLTNSSLRCGKWLLRSTKIQRSRGEYTRNRTDKGATPMEVA